MDNTGFVACLSLLQLYFLFPLDPRSYKLLVEQNSNWRKVFRVHFRRNRFRSIVRCGCCTLQSYTYIISMAYRRSVKSSTVLLNDVRNFSFTGDFFSPLLLYSITLIVFPCAVIMLFCDYTFFLPIFKHAFVGTFVDVWQRCLT